jgi:hypothetical protein
VAYITGYAFPRVLRDKVMALYPELEETEVTRVLDGLRAWFLVALHADGRTIGMPSTIVDDAWHEFILITRDYADFCEGAFGKFLHHAPAAVLEMPMQEGLRRTLRLAESASPHLLPFTGGAMILFALDEELGVEDGYAYPEAYLEELRRGSGNGGAGGCSGSADGGGDGGGCGGGCGGS